MSNYDKFPSTKINGKCICGYSDIISELSRQRTAEKYVFTIEAYPGTDDAEVIPQIMKLKPDTFINTKSIFKEETELSEQLRYHITEDRVFGKMYYGELADFMSEPKLAEAKEQVAAEKGLTIIYGFGAELVARGQTLVYLDLARWEIQQRFRRGMGNFNAENEDEDILRKYKRAFFIEWRMADKHKQRLLGRIDYLLDANLSGNPKMITGELFRTALDNLCRRPFRTVPYFDPGVWGGQWMKKVCGLDSETANFAWSFDGVPEENSLYLEAEGGVLEIPAMDLVLYRPKELLGEKNYARFGAEFPIRFDFLDTMDGQNLSLQVHPLTEYIKKNFGMMYTQDESYYVLDAKEDAVVYLGVKEGINAEEMLDELYEAQRGERIFDADRYINAFPAKKHDHFLIPAGTIHCSGKDTMILEISATPYIFTFKLWDWGRVGLDGLPRPLHIDHGKEVIQWDRDTKWVKENLINDICILQENEHWKEERTGLHELEFIETIRAWTDRLVCWDTAGTVNVLNLVEGEEAVIESPGQAFAPFVVHYAETFILPAAVGEYTIKPCGPATGKRITVIKAFVRNSEAEKRDCADLA